MKDPNLSKLGDRGRPDPMLIRFNFGYRDRNQVGWLCFKDVGDCPSTYAKQLMVRANAQYEDKAVTDPKPYQSFLTSFEKAMFLTAYEVD